MISITNYRKRLVTLLVRDGGTARAVRIPSGHTRDELPDAVLELDVVKRGEASGEFAVRRYAGNQSGARA